MKSKIFIGAEFLIFIALLVVVIMYSQVLIKKVIDSSVSDAQEQLVPEIQQIEIVASSTDNDTVFSTEEKYAWLLEQETSGATSSAVSDGDKKEYLKQIATSSNAVKPLTTEEKMKFLE